ncbi:hypothetical protein [Prosthecomicrobium hirschii]|uniref:hypothetical protein n=1 Tax=Prosthecodimorpha hirschii TaxID=665126 RepID=UPI00128EE916|nr:hypothetical protein [Prosthecomicrobium hirschii]
MIGGYETARACTVELKEIIDLYEKCTGKYVKESNVVEVGFGARPHRAFAFTAFFAAVEAIDIDVPVLNFRDILRVFVKTTWNVV